MCTLFAVLFIFSLFSCNFCQFNGTVDETNCRTLQNSGKNTSGPHQITLNGSTYTILCDQQLDGGGWTVIQQRLNGKETFWNRLWDDYKNGFGVVGENETFWAGNDLIHLLSSQQDGNVTLRVELYGDRNPNSSNKDAFYWSDYFFKFRTTQFKYRQRSRSQKGNASSGWYDFTYSNGLKFSTIDHINDPMEDCQLKYHLGGWWTKYCSLASLNGEYDPKQFGNGYGLFFTVAGQYVINPVRTRMLLRDKNE
ncbi:hypothetical protein M3Y97_01032900 [Aphelenchoides bicaudatus]|nr:hypothetical protein M3Y97_01032900 [Aphelenchoides bicaudatus]